MLFKIKGLVTTSQLQKLQGYNFKISPVYKVSGFDEELEWIRNNELMIRNESVSLIYDVYCDDFKNKMICNKQTLNILICNELDMKVKLVRNGEEVFRKFI